LILSKEIQYIKTLNKQDIKLAKKTPDL